MFKIDAVHPTFKRVIKSMEKFSEMAELYDVLLHHGYRDINLVITDDSVGYNFWSLNDWYFFLHYNCPSFNKMSLDEQGEYSIKAFSDNSKKGE